MTFLLHKFFFVGSALQQARHKKCLILLGKLRLHIFFQISLLAAGFDRPGLDKASNSTRIQYALLVMYLPFFIFCQLGESLGLHLLNRMPRTASAAWGSSSSRTLSSSQHKTVSSINAQTWVQFGKSFFGGWGGNITCLENKSRSQLSPLMRTFSSFPIR